MDLAQFVHQAYHSMFGSPHLNSVLSASLPHAGATGAKPQQAPADPSDGPLVNPYTGAHRPVHPQTMDNINQATGFGNYVPGFHPWVQQQFTGGFNPMAAFGGGGLMKGNLGAPIQPINYTPYTELKPIGGQ